MYGAIGSLREACPRGIEIVLEKSVVSVAQMCSTEVVTPGFPALCPYHLPLS